VDFPYLTIIIFLPILGTLLIAFMPGLQDKVIRRIAAVFTFIPMVDGFSSGALRHF